MVFRSGTGRVGETSLSLNYVPVVIDESGITGFGTRLTNLPHGAIFGPIPARPQYGLSPIFPCIRTWDAWRLNESDGACGAEAEVAGSGTKAQVQQPALHWSKCSLRIESRLRSRRNSKLYLPKPWRP